MLERCRETLESPLDENTYRDRFQLQLQAEEHQMNIDIRGYDMEVLVFYFDIAADVTQSKVRI